MRVVLAPQEFKGSLTAADAVRAMALGVHRAAPAAEIIAVAMADGGPGTLDAVLSARSGERRSALVHDPLGRLVQAIWGCLDDGTAVIEMAQAAGLVRLQPGERDATVTSTYGVGELIRAALDAGCRRFVIGVGGSATNDGGAGMAQALGARLLDAEERDLPPGGLALAQLARVDVRTLDPRLEESHFEVAVDVQNPLVGPEGASAVYGPQKGATKEQVAALDAALSHYAAILQRDLGVDVATLPGAGAAGGLAAGLVAFCKAALRPGAALVATLVRLREQLAGADLVLTGEGSLDGQTAYGKAVLEVIRAAQEVAIPVVVLAGALGPGWRALLAHGLTAAFSIMPGPLALLEAQAQAAELLTTATEQVIRLYALGATSRVERTDNEHRADIPA